MSFNYILIFSLTVFVASIIPGPSMLLALTHGMQYGARRTIASAFGNLTVSLIQAFISIIGLGTVLIASGTAFQIIKWAGAVYLIYIGVGLLRLPRISLMPGEAHKTAGPLSLRRMYLQGALVTAGNPKAIVFFVAVFPQFINPEMAGLPQFCLLMAVGGIIAFGCFMIYAAGGQKLISLFSQSFFEKYFKRIIGGTFIGTGIGLAVSGN